MNEKPGCGTRSAGFSADRGSFDRDQVSSRRIGRCSDEGCSLGNIDGCDPSVRYVKEAGDTLVQIDTNGDGTADMQIKLDHAMDLTASNFVL